MIVKEIYDKILYIEDVISDKNLVKDLENFSEGLFDRWDYWGGYNDPNSLYGRSRIVNPSKYENSTDREKNVFDILYNSMHDIIKIYVDFYNINVSLEINKNFIIKEYKEDCDMGYHADRNIYNPQLFISFVLYLNDNYEGGEIHFKNQLTNGLPVEIKPKAGSAILFPSTDGETNLNEWDKLQEIYYHGSKICKNGNKMFIAHFAQTLGEV